MRSLSITKTQTVLPEGGGPAGRERGWGGAADNSCVWGPGGRLPQPASTPPELLLLFRGFSFEGSSS
eukprot:6224898-Heterocapsa_arctica.AAC.1